MPPPLAATIAARPAPRPGVSRGIVATAGGNACRGGLADPAGSASLAGDRPGRTNRVGPMSEAGVQRIAFNLLLAVMIYVAVTGGA